MATSHSWRARHALFFIAALCSLLGLAGLFAAPAAAQDVQAVPTLRAHVMDDTGTLDAAQQQALEAKLTAFEQSRGTQIVVMMVGTTQPEDISSYTQRLGDAWKIGRKDVGDGLLIVVAQKDRKARIATAKALEGAIPDLAAKQIIDEALTPAFKRGDFAGGLDAATGRLMALISGENLPAPEDDGQQGSAAQTDDGLQWEDLGVFLFIAVPLGVRLLSGLLGRKLGSLFTGGVVGVIAWIFTASVLLTGIAAVLAVVFALFMSLLKFNPAGGSSGGGFSSGGWSSSSDSSSSGGFRSGGGGDFGGGGASGDW